MKQMSSAIKLTLVDLKGVSNKKSWFAEGVNLWSPKTTLNGNLGIKKYKTKLVFLHYHPHVHEIPVLVFNCWTTQFRWKNDSKHPCIDEHWVLVLKHYQIYHSQAIMFSQNIGDHIYRRKSANGLHLNSPTIKLKG